MTTSSFNPALAALGFSPGDRVVIFHADDLGMCEATVSGCADLFRAVCEGIAAGTAHVLETYAEVGASPDRVLAVGGGTKNALWLQATSDFGGVPQHVCEKTIGASYGDAFLAALAIGAAHGCT